MNTYCRLFGLFTEQEKLNPQVAIQMRSASNVLTAADVGIAYIDVVTRAVPGQAVHLDLMAGKPNSPAKSWRNVNRRFHHAT